MVQAKWGQFWGAVWSSATQSARDLLRVSQINAPEAVLLAPDQSVFLRENLKLKLLNARLALLSRQYDTAQADLRDAVATLERYFDRSVRRVDDHGLEPVHRETPSRTVFARC